MNGRQYALTSLSWCMVIVYFLHISSGKNIWSYICKSNFSTLNVKNDYFLFRTKTKKTYSEETLHQNGFNDRNFFTIDLDTCRVIHNDFRGKVKSKNTNILHKIALNHLVLYHVPFARYISEWWLPFHSFILLLSKWYVHFLYTWNASRTQLIISSLVFVLLLLLFFSHKYWLFIKVYGIINERMNEKKK